jgi:hypothetical protein
MAKKKNTNKNKSSTQRYKRATRNVQLQQQPQVDQLNAMLQQAQQDALRQDQSAQSIFGGYQDELRDVPRGGYNQISDDLLQRMGTLGGLFQGGGVQGMVPGGIGESQEIGLPTSEVQAAQGLGTAIGQGGLDALSSYAAREGGAREAAGREGAVAERYARSDVQNQMQDTLQNYRNQLLGISSQTPSLISQEEDSLRQDALERKLAMSQMQGDKAFSEFLQGQLGGMVDGNNRSNGPPRNNGTRPPNFGPGGNGDTSAGGNNSTGRGGGTVPWAVTDNQGANPNNQQQGQVPQSWSNAQEWNDLPPVVTHRYNRPYGVTARASFQETPHPSFDNFGQFQDAWQQAKHRINQLYNARGGPGYDAGHRGPR